MLQICPDALAGFPLSRNVEHRATWHLIGEPIKALDAARNRHAQVQSVEGFAATRWPVANRDFAKIENAFDRIVVIFITGDQLGPLPLEALAVFAFRIFRALLGFITVVIVLIVALWHFARVGQTRVPAGSKRG